MRSVFDALDTIDQLSAKFEDLDKTLDKLDTLQPKLVALIPPQIQSQETNHELTLTNYATLSGIYAQTAAAIDNATALGRAFDAAKNDDTFYLPPEVFNNPDFKRGLKLFLSPDGKAVRMIVTHEGDPATPEGISHIDPIANAAHEALKGTPMADAKIYLGGTSATYKDIQEGAKYDLLIVGIRRAEPHLADHDDHHPKPDRRACHRGHRGPVAGRLVRVVRAGVAVHVRHRAVLGGARARRNPAAGSRIRLQPAVDLPIQGRDPCRPEDGVIRAMAGSGSVVTSAGIVFAVTMCAFVFSGFLVLGQIGTTIGLGLLFDTLIVRSFMTPSVATLLGRWFWWPQRVRPRPASTMLRPYGTRSAVRQLLLWDDDDPVPRPNRVRVAAFGERQRSMVATMPAR